MKKSFFGRAFVCIVFWPSREGGADDFFPDLLLGGAGIGGGVRHDESGAALFVQRGVEMLDPEVIAIVGARDAEGVARISGKALLVDLIDGLADIRALREAEQMGEAGFGGLSGVPRHGLPIPDKSRAVLARRGDIRSPSP